MSDLISKDTVKEWLNSIGVYGYDWQVEELPSAEHHKLNVAEYIKDNFPDVWKQAEKELEVPSAEPQIIRCKECKHYNKFIVTLSKTGQAVWDEYCEKFRRSVTADDYCSRAERREEE